MGEGPGAEVPPVVAVGWRQPLDEGQRLLSPVDQPAAVDQRDGGLGRQRVARELRQVLAQQRQRRPACPLTKAVIASTCCRSRRPSPPARARACSAASLAASNWRR